MSSINSPAEFSALLDAWIRFFAEDMADAVHGMTEPAIV